MIVRGGVHLRGTPCVAPVGQDVRAERGIEDQGWLACGARSWRLWRWRWSRRWLLLLVEAMTIRPARLPGLALRRPPVLPVGLRRRVLPSPVRPAARPRFLSL